MFFVANHMWRLERETGVPVLKRMVLYLDHLFLTGWRYRRHVRLSMSGGEGFCPTCGRKL